MNYYCAEVAWMKCMDGLKIPLEIAFASVYDPDVVHLVEICVPMNLELSLRDLAETKSYAGNKDRYANHWLNGPERKLSPTRVLKVDLNGWLPALHDIANYLFGDNFVLLVRCPSQLDFFKRICGFQARMKPVPFIPNGQTYGCWHRHGKLIPYLCPATEARTMAVALKLNELRLSYN